jgi:hypothetical protein
MFCAQRFLTSLDIGGLRRWKDHLTPAGIRPQAQPGIDGRYTALLPDCHLRSSRFDVSHLDHQPASIFGFRYGHGSELARKRASAVEPSCHANSLAIASSSRRSTPSQLYILRRSRAFPSLAKKTILLGLHFIFLSPSLSSSYMIP